jgi:hypothetical protein
MKPIDISCLIREPEATYRAKAKHHLTSHQLTEFRKNPLLYHKRQMGLIPDEDRPAYLIGRAAHTLILEGREVFERSYAVGGPINARTGKPYGANTQAYADWAAAQGKPVITDDQRILVEYMAASVRDHECATDLLSAGTPEGVLRGEHAGMACQSRLDWVNPGRGIVDLKTADNLDYFEVDARSYGYAYQCAFYRSMLAIATEIIAPVFIIAVEKREPFRTGVWVVGQNILALAQKENESAIQRLKRCRDNDTWKTGYEAVRNYDYL